MCLPTRSFLKIKSPLVFAKANSDFVIETLDRILDENALRTSYLRCAWPTKNSSGPAKLRLNIFCDFLLLPGKTFV